MTTSVDTPPVVPRGRGAIYFEILVTFGLFAIPSFLNSFHRYLTNTPSSRHPMALVAFVVQELLLIGLFFYVLAANGERFGDLSRPPEWRDVRRAVVLGIRILPAYLAAGYALYLWTSLLEPAGDSGVMASFHDLPRIPFFAFLMVNPFCEELWMRVYLQTRLGQLGWPVWAIVTTSAGLQAAYHLYQGVGRALLYVIIFGMFAAHFQRTRRVTPIVGLHLLSDLGFGIRIVLGG
jgi:membrane protease YdiL (CAAX protease family)